MVTDDSKIENESYCDAENDSDNDDSDSIELITNMDEFEPMALNEAKRQKEYLSDMKQRVMLSLDQRKLEQAQKLMTGMNTIVDIFGDYEIMEKVKSNVGTAMDMKFLSEAYSKLADQMVKLQRLDSIDAQGTPGRLSVGVRYQGGDGSTVETVVNVGQ